MSTQVAISEAGPLKDMAPAPIAGAVVVVKEQDPAPAQVGGVYSRVLSSSIDDSGACVFSATLSRSSVDSAIFLAADGTTHVIAQQGEPAPGGGSFLEFEEVDVAWYRFLGDENRFVVFRAQLQGSAADEGIFLWQSASGIQAVVLAGQRSPRGKTYQSFAQTNIGAVTTNTGVGYNIVSVATMTDGAKEIFWSDSDRGAAQPLATGDTISENNVVVDIIGLSRMGAIYRSCLVKVSDGTTTFTRVCTVNNNFVTTVFLKEGKRFPGLGKVSSLASPPSLTNFSSVLMLTFKSGASCLIFSAQLGGPSGTPIIARSGDYIPGDKEEQITAFGAPVSTSEYPTNPASNFPPVSIASVVQLKGGQAGIWFVHFPGNVPAAPRLLATEGDPIGDQGATVGSFSLIKITNAVTLLFQATVTQSGRSLGAVLAFENILGPPPVIDSAAGAPGVDALATSREDEHDHSSCFD
jgi:hypothetical protein